MARSSMARFTRKAKIQIRAASKVPVSSSGRNRVVTAALVAAGHRIPVDFMVLRPRENKYGVAQQIIQRV